MTTPPDDDDDARHPVGRALVSVSDKTGVVDFARALRAAGVEILSTGGTARALVAGGVEVRDVSDYTGFPEIMGGRVKTLHPRVHGGLLARRDADADAMREHGIAGIDLLAVNFYPFAEAVTYGCAPEKIVENIDVGGPAMIRAAAKNYRYVTVVVDPEDYAGIAAMLKDAGGIACDKRLALAAKAFEHTATYDHKVSVWFAARAAPTADAPAQTLPQTWGGHTRMVSLRYGENPHQRAALYGAGADDDSCVYAARQLQGKRLSFNNYLDADAACRTLREFGDTPACVIVKHANPCAVACADDAVEAYARAHAADPLSAFGGVIALNRVLDEATARAVVTKQFAEVVAVPEAHPGAVEAMAAKPNVRLLVYRDAARADGLDVKNIDGGLLVQQQDRARVEADDLRVVTRRKPSAAEIADLLFAWRVVKHVHSNAIVIAAANQTLGIGGGQTSRVDAVQIALHKAARCGHSLAGAVLASDGFFPFEDGLALAHDAGIAAVIQPGGSVNDDKVIAAADARGIAMVFTGVRHFSHG